MKLKLMIAGLALALSSTAFAADAKLKDSVDAEVKTAVEAAMQSVAAAGEAKGEWFWAKPTDKMWEGGKLTSGKIVKQMIELANDGKNDEAKKLAAFLQKTADAGVKQVQKMKGAGPLF